MHLTQGIHRAAQISADLPALVSGQQSYNWREFKERVARLAGAFQAHGIGAGDRVAMLASNSQRFVEFYFATLWAGGVIQTVNTRWAFPEMVHCLNDGAAKLLLTDTGMLPEALRLRAECSSIRALIHADEGSTAAASENVLDYETLITSTNPVEDARRGGEDLAALFYTGGTTGKSKGVMLSHNNFMANSMNALKNLGLDSDSVHLHVSPLFHLAGGSRVFSVTVAGATHAVIPRFDPDLFLSAIERHRVTVTVVVPTMLNTLLQHPRLDDYDLSSLRLLTYGASPMPQALLKSAMDRLPHVSFLQSYGMTELSPVVTMLLPKYHCFDGPDAGRIRSAGQAVFNADLAVMNERDEVLPHGEIGEICARGPMVMQGYWQQPELTAQAMRNGWMHTGDAGYMDEDGFLFLVDRVKDMIITGGENVYSAAVENALYQHPAVLECAVIGIPDDTWGERVHAVVVIKSGTAATAQELIDHCRSYLAGYECPKSIEFQTSELPKSGVGKILKVELRKPYWEGESRGIH